MSVTQAIKTASSHVRMFRSGRQWIVVSPYYRDQLDGPTTHSLPADYWKTRRLMTTIRARVALTLLGFGPEWTDIEDIGDIRLVVSNVVRQHKSATQ